VEYCLLAAARGLRIEAPDIACLCTACDSTRRQLHALTLQRDLRRLRARVQPWEAPWIDIGNSSGG
jgi:hypothetical protein